MPPAKLIALGLLVLILLPIIVIDLRERRIPNSLNAALAVAGFAVQVAGDPSVRTALLALLPPLAIIAVFLALIALMKLLKRPGSLGLGDVKFLAAASLWVGFTGSALIFVVASLLALAFVVARAPWHKLDLRAAIAFGPFLAAGLVIIFTFSSLSGGAGG